MNMVVCVKQVIDPEAPVASFKIDPSSNTVVPPSGVPPVINPFDLNALEAALQILVSFSWRTKLAAATQFSGIPHTK